MHLLVEIAICVVSVGGTAFACINCTREVRALKKQLAEMQSPACFKARAKDYQAIIRAEEYRTLRAN